MVSYKSLCVYWRWPSPLQRFQVIFVLIGGFLVHLTLGSIYTYGNMVPYIIAYIRNQSQPSNIRSDQAPFVLACQAGGQGAMMILGGLLEKKIGPRLSTLIGGWLMSAGVLLTFFTIKVSFWLVLVTYGLMFGFGVGIGYIGPITCAMKWMPKWKGVGAGIVVAGFGLSATLFNFVQTEFINPSNFAPNLAPYPDNPKEKYFTQDDLLERVPYSFLLLGGVFAVIQLIGCVFLVDPPVPDLTYSKLPSDDISSLHSDSNSITVSSSSKADSTCPDGIKPQVMLRKLNFYLLWTMFFLGGIAVSFISSLYKQFGLEEFGDDHFLSAVGSVSSVFNFVGRLLWGLLADTVAYKFALTCQTALMTCLLLTLYLTVFGGKWMFLFWVCGLFFCVGGIFSLFPAATVRSFGPAYFGLNYGLLSTSLITGSIVAALLASQLITLISWWGMFFLLSGLSGVGFFIALCYRHTSYN